MGIVYSDRWVYNSDFHDVHLLNVKIVQKLISMCRFTKPNVLFSDVVKKTNQSKIRTHDSVTRKPRAKISKSNSVQVCTGMVMKQLKHVCKLSRIK